MRNETTPATLTDAELMEIEARCEAATPGPWSCEPHGDTGNYGVGVILDQNGNPISGRNEDSTLDVIEPVAIEVTTSINARFIAHARVDLPRLLAEVRRLKKTCDDLTAKSALITIAATAKAVAADARAEQMERERDWLANELGKSDAVCPPGKSPDNCVTEILSIDERDEKCGKCWLDAARQATAEETSAPPPTLRRESSTA